jgi:hypothetical protein
MSDRRYCHPLRSKSLPVALACALAVSVGGCSTWPGAMGFGAFGQSQAACRSDDGSDAWPAKVMASVQRAETKSGSSDYVADYSLDDTPKDTAPEPVQEKSQVAAPEPAQETAQGLPEDIPPDIPQSVAPTPPAEVQSPVVDEPSDIAIEHPPEPAAPTVEQPPDVAVAVPPPPVAPPRPEPSAEVIEVCGATDTACQDQLTALLADPLHKWIKEKPTPHDERTGVRTLAYRVLAPVLACEDLRQGVRETEAIAAGIDSGADSGAAQPAARGEGKSLEWVQLLNRAVKLELKAEIEKRC